MSSKEGRSGRWSRFGNLHKWAVTELMTVSRGGLSRVDLALRTGSRRRVSRIVLMWLTWMSVSCPVERVVLKFVMETPAFKIV